MVTRELLESFTGVVRLLNYLLPVIAVILAVIVLVRTSGSWQKNIATSFSHMMTIPVFVLCWTLSANPIVCALAAALMIILYLVSKRGDPNWVPVSLIIIALYVAMAGFNVLRILGIT